MSKKKGKLEAYIGPMFANKTTELIKRAGQAQTALMFKPSMDSRYGGGQEVHSHNGLSFPAELFDAKNPQEILQVLHSLLGPLNVVLIDEIQFCSGEITIVLSEIMVMGLDVAVAGLDLDYKQDPFGPMPEVLKLANKVEKLTAVCDGCGGAATLTYAKMPLSQVENVGAEEIFGVACAQCHPKLRGDMV